MGTLSNLAIGGAAGVLIGMRGNREYTTRDLYNAVAISGMANVVGQAAIIQGLRHNMMLVEAQTAAIEFGFEGVQQSISAIGGMLDAGLSNLTEMVAAAGEQAVASFNQISEQIAALQEASGRSFAVQMEMLEAMRSPRRTEIAERVSEARRNFGMLEASGDGIGRGRLLEETCALFDDVIKTQSCTAPELVISGYFFETQMNAREKALALYELAYAKTDKGRDPDGAAQALRSIAEVSAQMGRLADAASAMDAARALLPDDPLVALDVVRHLTAIDPDKAATALATLMNRWPGMYTAAATTPSIVSCGFCVRILAQVAAWRTLQEIKDATWEAMREMHEIQSKVSTVGHAREFAEMVDPSVVIASRFALCRTRLAKFEKLDEGDAVDSDGESELSRGLILQFMEDRPI